MATLVLDSAKVSSDKIEEKGFVFEFPWLEDALTDLHERRV
jgi:NAD dependent epimerase/dehydratase family enzyme